MEKRKILFGDYDTAERGWTLSAWQLSPAEQKTNYVDIPGGNGTWDLSTVLTDGQPRYTDRILTVSLERSDGDRLTRKTAIREIVNLLDGTRQKIMLPDDLDYYLTGRVSVAVDYNDPAHASVALTAICSPWLYAQTARRYVCYAGGDEQTVTISNDGRLAVVPEITVEGSGAEVRLGYKDRTWQISEGVYVLPDLYLPPGTAELTYIGSGTITLTYREAVLE
mgnify:CR=1 FL=1